MIGKLRLISMVLGAFGLIETKTRVVGESGNTPKSTKAKAMREKPSFYYPQPLKKF